MNILHTRLFYRITRKNWEIYFLKIVTLSIALACGILITLFALKEFGYDQFHDHAAKVVRVLQRNEGENFQGNRLSNRISPDVYASMQKELKDAMVLSRIKVLEHLNITNQSQSFINERIYITFLSPTIRKYFVHFILIRMICWFMERYYPGVRTLI